MRPIPHRPIVLAALLTTTALAGCVGLGNADAHPVKEIAMWVEPMDWEVHPGVTTPVWAFCADGDGVEPVHGDDPCGVPAPTIRVREGDLTVGWGSHANQEWWHGGGVLWQPGQQLRRLGGASPTS